MLSRLLFLLGVSCLVIFLAWPEFFSKAEKRGISLVSNWVEPGFVSDILRTYEHAWHGAQRKIDEIRHLELQNTQLRQENAQLRLSLDAVRWDCHAQVGLRTTRDYELKLKKETGQKVGRSLAGINYKPPTRMPLPLLYSLAISYLKVREDEKVAV